MTTNDDLDDFFKKKDRKSHKKTKQTGLLSNNEELLKQLGLSSFDLTLSLISLLLLVIVTSATSAFKENLELDDDDDEQLPTTTTDDKTAVGTGLTTAEHTRSSKSKTIDESTNRTSNGQSKNLFDDGTGNTGQDEWEEFDSANSSKYEQLRLKFAARNDNDDYDDDDVDERLNRNDENHEDNHDREQNKDKPVWNIHQVNETAPAAAAAIAEEKVEEPAPKPAASSGAYRPPQLRTGGSGVTVVSGGQQKSSKKKEPNFASTDEFPTLKSTVNKK